MSLSFFQIHMPSRSGDMIIVVSTVAVPRIAAKMILKKEEKKLFMHAGGPLCEMNFTIDYA